MSQLSIIPPPISSITAWSKESIGDKVAAFGGGYLNSSKVSTAYPSANLAMYIPFYTPWQITIAQLFWHDGATLSGNVDCGVYDSQGHKLVSTGSKAQSGGSANTLRITDVTDTIIAPGKYYIAISMDNTTGTLFAIALGSVLLDVACGIKQQASAFTLPSTFTLAQATQDYVPIFGFATKAVF